MSNINAVGEFAPNSSSITTYSTGGDTVTETIVTEYEYDTEGRVVKEKITKTTTKTTPRPYVGDPVPYRYPYQVWYGGSLQSNT